MRRIQIVYGVDENSFPDNRSAAVDRYFPVPADLRNPEAREIAKGIAERGRLAFAHGSNIEERRSFIKRLFCRTSP